MKKRSYGFLSDEKIPHDSEIFLYIQELHNYLWRFIRTEIPGASGLLRNFVDAALEQAERKTKTPASTRASISEIVQALKAELVPQQGHPDPGALDDCWKELEEQMDLLKKAIDLESAATKLALATGQSVESCRITIQEIIRPDNWHTPKNLQEKWDTLERFINKPNI